MCDVNRKMSSDDPTLERHFRGHRDSVTALAFNPTMKQLASSSLDSSIMVWNFRQMNRAFRFKAHKDGVMDISFSPSGQLVASVSRDRSVRLWVPTVQGETGEFRAHTGAVRSIHFSPDGQRMVTASDDKSVKIWGVSRRKFISALLGHNNWVRCARFSPNGQLVATCSDDKTVRLYDPNSSLCVHVFQEIKGSALNVEFHPSGTCIGTAMTNNVVKVYDIRMHKLLQHYCSHDGAVNKIAFHPCGNYLLTASCDCTMKVCYVRVDDRELAELQIAPEEARQNQEMLRSRIQKKKTYVKKSAGIRSRVRQKEGKVGGALAQQMKFLGHVLWRREERRDGDCGREGEDICEPDKLLPFLLQVMDLLEGRPIYTLQGHEGSITSVAFSANGEYFASGGADQQILVWKTNFDRQDLLREFPQQSPQSYLKEASSEINSPDTFQVDARKAISDKSQPDIVEMAVESKDSERSNILLDTAANCNTSETQGIVRDENFNPNKYKAKDDHGDSPSLVTVRAKYSKQKHHSIHTSSSDSSKSHISPNQSTDGDNSQVLTTLENLCGQVETLRQTVLLMEQRLTILEDKVKDASI
ncbi:hypothetical protein ANN_07760 [Periplaneta americana]|uniref:WD repeat-containing protein 55 homolog n=1 Tax=Periplaneta americana TaxID=6978 RepID=A0ABQ8SZH2_PERAM|nr:hypothetical protein ANN_07760 [Periplaneta americana]